MGNTTIHNLPYPEATDPADVPTDMRELAQALDPIIGAVDLSKYVHTTSKTNVIARWGLIAAAGTITAGSGDYTVTRTAAGMYTITWSAPYAEVPGMAGNGVSLNILRIVSVTATAAQVGTLNNSFLSADGSFVFVAIGPA